MKQQWDSHKEEVTEMKREVDDLKDDITDVKVNYLQKEDFSEFKNELWARLEEIKQQIRNGHGS